MNSDLTTVPFKDLKPGKCHGLGEHLVTLELAKNKKKCSREL